MKFSNKPKTGLPEGMDVYLHVLLVVRWSQSLSAIYACTLIS